MHFDREFLMQVVGQGFGRVGVGIIVDGDIATVFCEFLTDKSTKSSRKKLDQRCKYRFISSRTITVTRPSPRHFYLVASKACSKISVGMTRKIKHNCNAGFSTSSSSSSISPWYFLYPIIWLTDRWQETVNVDACVKLIYKDRVPHDHVRQVRVAQSGSTCTAATLTPALGPQQPPEPTGFPPHSLLCSGWFA
jgi:hypothetical protein